MTNVLHSENGVQLILNKKDSCDVLFIGITKTPNIDALRNLRSFFQNTLQESSKHNTILHIQHIGNERLDLPDINFFQEVAEILNAEKKLVKEKVLGTIVQTQTLDMIARIGKDIFLELYKPKRPLFIVEGDTEMSQSMEHLIKSKSELH